MIILKNLSKSFSLTKAYKIPIIKNLNLKLPSTGLIAIVGKSGCGKSTLLNILATIDKPTSGTYLFDNKDVSKISKKERRVFLNRRIGIVFQHYNLLEDKDVLFNISLPSQISGTKIKENKKDILRIMNHLNIDESFINKKVKDLSGGEKQRIAIIRALVNSPSLLLCDEPTGALDSKNSLIIMNMLKKASENRLVLIVSHNLELIDKYADRIITLKDGSIVNDVIKNNTNKVVHYQKDYNFRKNNKWIEEITKQNIKKHRKRNIFSIISIVICMLFTSLIIGFASHSGAAIEIESKKHIDYGVISISKEENNDIEGSFISLTRQSRPDTKKINELKTHKEFVFTNNYDILLPVTSSISFDDKELSDTSIRGIYSFTNSYIDSSLLIKGVLPINDNFNEIVINKKCYYYLLNTLGKDPLNISLNIKHNYESSYYSFDIDNSVIKDVYELNKKMKIVGVVDELDFLSSPTIYYSYKSFISYLDKYPMNNLSNYFNETISWKTRIDRCGDNDELSSYSIKGFLANYQNNIYLKEYVDEINKQGVTASSLALTIEESLSSLINASATGMELFLAISLIGLVLIIGIISFFSYSEDHKRSAILSALGASNSDIANIYLSENIIVGVIGFFISIALTFPAVILVNKLLKNITGLDNLVKFPTNLISNIKFDYLLIALFLFVLVIVIATLIPIFFSKKISIVQELREE